MIGIIGAMHEEIVELKKIIDGIVEHKFAGFVYFKGKMHGKDVVLVESGIGKVNSSICTTLLIEKFGVEKVIFTGVAGGIGDNIEVGDIVISSDLIQHDFDVTAFGLPHGAIPRMKESTFKANEKMIELAKESSEEVIKDHNVRVGRVLSGDQFISSKEKLEWLKDTFNGECTEMEGASVAHVCDLFDIPFVVLRAISDKADSEAHMDFQEFVHLAANNAKLIVEKIVEKIEI